MFAQLKTEKWGVGVLTFLAFQFLANWMLEATPTQFLLSIFNIFIRFASFFSLFLSISFFVLLQFLCVTQNSILGTHSHAYNVQIMRFFLCICTCLCVIVS